MKRNIIYTALTVLGLFVGYIVAKETPPWPCPTHHPDYYKLRSDLMIPDTAVCYWDKGALYILFVKPHASDDTTEVVAEDDQ